MYANCEFFNKNKNKMNYEEICEEIEKLTNLFYTCQIEVLFLNLCNHTYFDVKTSNISTTCKLFNDQKYSKYPSIIDQDSINSNICTHLGSQRIKTHKMTNNKIMLKSCIHNFMGLAMNCDNKLFRITINILWLYTNYFYTLINIFNKNINKNNNIYVDHISLQKKYATYIKKVYNKIFDTNIIHKTYNSEEMYHISFYYIYFNIIILAVFDDKNKDYINKIYLSGNDVKIDGDHSFNKILLNTYKKYTSFFNFIIFLLEFSSIDDPTNFYKQLQKLFIDFYTINNNDVNNDVNNYVKKTINDIIYISPKQNKINSSSYDEICVKIISLNLLKYYPINTKNMFIECFFKNNEVYFKNKNAETYHPIKIHEWKKNNLYYIEKNSMLYDFNFDKYFHKKYSTQTIEINDGLYEINKYINLSFKYSLS